MKLTYLSCRRHDGGERPAQELYVWAGATSDGTKFTEILRVKPLTVQNRYLPLPVLPVGIQIWQSGNP